MDERAGRQHGHGDLLPEAGQGEEMTQFAKVLLHCAGRAL